MDIDAPVLVRFPCCFGAMSHASLSPVKTKHCTRGTGAKGGWNGGKGPSWSEEKYFNSGKGEKGANRAGTGQWSRTCGKKGGEGQEQDGKGDIRVCWSCGETGHIAAKLHQGESEQESERL